MKDLKQVVFETMASHRRTISQIDKMLDNGDLTLEEATQIGNTQNTIHSVLMVMMLEAGVWEEYKQWESENN